MKQVAFKSKVQCMPTIYTTKYGNTWTPFCGKTFESQLDVSFNPIEISSALSPLESQLDINAMKDELGIKG